MIASEYHILASDRLWVSIEMPYELLDQLRNYQTKHGIESPSHAAVKILTQFFQANSANTYAPLNRVESLEARVQNLSLQVEALKQLLVQSEDLAPAPNRTRPLGKTAAESSEPITVHTPNQTPSQSDPGPQPPLSDVLAYEDIEDMPDEILYDFLPINEGQ